MNLLQRLELEILIFNTANLRCILPRLYCTSKAVSADINAILHIDPTKTVQDVPRFGKHGAEEIEPRPSKYSITERHLWYLGEKLWIFYNAQGCRNYIVRYTKVSDESVILECDNDNDDYVEERSITVSDQTLTVHDGAFTVLAYCNGESIEENYNTSDELLRDYPEYGPYLFWFDY